MSNECGTQLSDAVGWRSLNKQARYQAGGRNGGMTERRQGTDVSVFLRFLLRKSFFPSKGTHKLTQRNYTIHHFPALFFLRRGER